MSLLAPSAAAPILCAAAAPADAAPVPPLLTATGVLSATGLPDDPLPARPVPVVTAPLLLGAAMP
jgi:hypothetical protein